MPDYVAVNYWMARPDDHFSPLGVVGGITPVARSLNCTSGVWEESTTALRKDNDVGVSFLQDSFDRDAA